VITGAAGDHEPISAIHPHAISKERNDLLAAAISDVLRESEVLREKDTEATCGGAGREESASATGRALLLGDIGFPASIAAHKQLADLLAPGEPREPGGAISRAIVGTDGDDCVNVVRMGFRENGCKSCPG
jgi:hypothetical protein